MNLNQKNFNEEILNSETALVDFGCSWCLPSQSEKIILEELEKGYEGKTKIGFVNVDQNPVLREKYNIMGVPTFILFKKGKELKRAVGARSKEQLVSFIEKI
jgi:thioredoxin 1